MKLDGLTAIIINPDIGSRSRLREVLKHAVYKISLTYMQSLKEASERIDSLCNNEVVLLSTKLGEENVRAFIATVMNSDKKHPSFIVTLEGRTHDMISRVSSMYLDGVEGFITEPYSSDDLVALLTAIRSKKTKEDTLTKQKKTMQFVFLESVRCIDVMARSYSAGQSLPGDIIKEVRNLISSTRTLFEQNPELYASILSDIFERIPAPVQTEQRKQKTIKALLPHPGRVISDIMRERKLTTERLQASLKVEPSEFQNFLECKISLDEHLSRELSRLFGRTSKEWMRMQKDFDQQQEALSRHKSITGSVAAE